MKKTIILLTSLILILILTACSGETADTGGEIHIVAESNAEESSSEIPIVAESGGEISNAPENTVMLNTDYENALPVQMQLILGTVKLDETEYAVDTNQAAELLPLWKAARSLSQSETVAAVEMEAIFNQIAETMTAEQLAAIIAMRLSQVDLADVAESLGIEISSGGKFGDMTPEEIAAAQAARGSGQAPPGSIPGNGGPAGPLAGGPGNNTAGERQGQRGATSGINAMFFDAIIALLEAKTQ
jgi:hypothetical protein